MNHTKPNHYTQDPPADLPDRRRWPATRRALVLWRQEVLDRELALPLARKFSLAMPLPRFELDGLDETPFPLCRYRDDQDDTQPGLGAFEGSP